MVDALTHPIADVRARITEAMKLEQQQHTDRTRRSLGKVTIHRAAGELGIAPQTVEKALDDPAIHEKLGKIATTQRGTELQHPPYATPSSNPRRASQVYPTTRGIPHTTWHRQKVER